MRKYTALLLVVMLTIPLITIFNSAHANEDVLKPQSQYVHKNAIENQQLLEQIKHTIPSGIPLKTASGKPINATLWRDKGIAVYGDPKIANAGSANNWKEGTQINGVVYQNQGYYTKDFETNGAKGEYRYHGFDMSDNKYDNINFIDDATASTAHSDKEWLYRPWIDYNGRTKRIDAISLFNERALDNHIQTQQWINSAVTWSLGSSENAGGNPQAYNYIHVLSPPSLLHGGEGTMWHRSKNTGKIWYETFSIPTIQEKEQLPVKAEIKILSKPEEFKFREDQESVIIKVEVTGTLIDDTPLKYYDDQLLYTQYYTRRDIADWEIRLIHSGGPFDETQIVNKSEGNKGKAVFEVEIQRSQIQADGTIEFIGYTQATYYNSKRSERASAKTEVTFEGGSGKGFKSLFNINHYIQLLNGNYFSAELLNYSDASIGELVRYDYEITYSVNGIKHNFHFVSSSVSDTEVNQRLHNFIKPIVDGKSDGVYNFVVSQKVTNNKGADDTYTKAVTIEIKPLEIETVTPDMDVNMPDKWFDIVPYPVQDNSKDFSSRTVKVDGVSVNAAQFFAGNYVFGESDVDKLVYIELEYEFDSFFGVIPPTVEPEFGIGQWVYVYSTKPRAEYNRIEGTFKENRKLSVMDNSNNVNPEFVLNHYPITNYQWRFKSNGGNIDSLRKKDISQWYKEFLFKEAGAYTIELVVTNALGRVSDPYTVDIWIHEDYEPAVILNLWNSVLLRDEEINMFHDVESVDDDIISKNIFEVYYDNNNDGEATQLLGVFSPEEFEVFKPAYLGNYRVKNIVEESLGQDTLSEFITDDDKKISIVERDFFVENLIPMTELFIDIPIVMPEIDVYIMIDQNMARNKASTLIGERVNLNNYLRSKNIRAKVETWDMHTYVYSQPASTTRYTGGSYPPATTSYSSGGYSGTLNRTSVSNYPYSVDEGYWKTVTNTTTRTVRHWTQQVAPWPSGWPEPGWNYGDGWVNPDGSHWTSWYMDEVITETTQTQVWVSNWVSYDDYVGYYSGTIYQHVRQPYTSPWRTTSDKYIIYISDNNISQLNDFNSVLSKADTKLILIGQNNIQGQIAHEHFILNNKDVDELIYEAMNYIASNNPYTAKYYVLAGETTFNLQYYNHEDEGDPIIEDHFLYVQNQDYFDTPLGLEAFAVANYTEDNWTNTHANIFNKTGKFEIYRRIKDRPSIDPNFQDFNYYSNIPMLEVYSHRRPIALAELDWDYDSTRNVYLTTWVDKSFDWDHIESRADKGIVERIIRYRRNSGEWIYKIPDELTSGTYNLEYLVKDPEGTWSHPFVLNFTLSSSPPMQMNAKARPLLINKFSMSSIPASESLELYDIWTRYPYDVTLQVAMYQGSTQRTPTQTITFNAATGTRAGNDIKWNNIVHNIPSTLPDGNYTLRITAVGSGGQSSQMNFPVTVHTPINLQSLMPESLVTLDTVDIPGRTTKYANSVSVQLYRGQPFTTTISLIGTQESDIKNWTRSYFVPGSIPDGDYIARYTATTPNGNSEYVDVPFRVDSLKVSGYLEPNPAMAGDEIIFHITTEGFADRLEIFVDPDIMSMDKRVEMGYPAQQYPLTFNVDNSLSIKTDIFKYILWVTTDETQDKDGYRLRPPYTFTVRAWKGSVSREIELQLEVQRNILELLKPGIKNNR